MSEAGLPLVSVVIPAYNAEAHLEECLESVLAQRGAFRMEVVVVDDGSKDRSAEIAQAHAGVRCIVQANQGPSAARNTGIREAAGDFVAFLDADDLWPPGKLDRQLTVLARLPSCSMVAGDCRQFDRNGRRARTEFADHGLGDGEQIADAYARLLDHNFVTTGSVVARRESLVEAGGFAEDLRLVEDLDLWLRLARRSGVAWCADECLWRRRHEHNISLDGEAVGLAFLQVLNRHRSGWSTEEQGLLHASRRIESREYRLLAAMASRKGLPGVALQRLGRSVSAAPGFESVLGSLKVLLRDLPEAFRSRA
ncbi:glycosyltransferase family 2 protein [Rubrivivax gelatinosus]|uniref:Glycosyl transferase family 2 n=1 Tax=Rubrivivax gelatinosus (strain NBRC 100245 / IL144) TaxID=983917 RepID=I0HL88_RUBGI|nr:glycosyltransferase family A protein [Rubrivivax gelatinosus]BAL93775.1 glycosyl transferase family 2 [Rubrivivax gelatinosus IL144]